MLIATLTGTRAEFGLLLPVIRAIAAHPKFTHRLIVTGTHLTTGSVRDITVAGLNVDARVPMHKKGHDGRWDDVAALGRGVAGVGRALEKLKPDVLLVLGDRIEAMAGALAASVGGVAVGHLHGGDRAEGVADEAIRHAISKLAHLHFPATAESKRRLIRMGEPEGLVFQVGSPAIDGLRSVDAAPDAPEVIVLMHPVGDEAKAEQKRMAVVLAATRGCRRLVLWPNHDPGRGGVVEAIGAEHRRGLKTDQFAEHLPRDKFLAVLKGAGAIVGNSSAGLIEAAALGTPCLNLGTRQDGRQKPASVVDGQGIDAKSIQRDLKRVLAMRPRPTKVYGQGDTGPRIAQILASLDLKRLPLRKCNAY